MAGTDTTFALPEGVSKERQEQERLIAEVELRRKAKTVVVPTDDGKVRAMLRQLDQPITLFGEREMERRERLRRLLASQDVDLLADMPAVGQVVLQQAGPAQTEKFYTEGSEELKVARAAIAQWSLRRAADRIAKAKRRRDTDTLRLEAQYMRRAALSQAKNFVQQSSEMADERPISGCEFSPTGDLLATCGWGGQLACWSVGDACTRVWSVRGHAERITGLAWHPGFQGDAASTGNGMDAEGAGAGSQVALATASADNTARLFSGTGKLLQTLSGHTDRLARLAFHPTGHYLATASFDLTWRLWDVERATCLLEQEGHSRAVYAVGFHPDGSLAASTGLDAVVRLWDCRTGRSPCALEGHVKQVLCLDFHPGGVQLVTGSDDHTCKVWDLRQRQCMYTVPAHTSLVSSCKYERGCGGAYLVTGGYDSLVKVWSVRDYALVKTLAGHEGKVMGVDVTSTDVSVERRGPRHLVASVAYDRTLKMWAPEQLPDIAAVKDEMMMDE